MNRKWLLTTALTFSFAGLPLIARADADMKFRDLPEGVKKKVESERHDRDVKKVTLVEHDGRKWYRIVLDKKGPEDEVLRVSPAGELLGAEVDRDVRANAPTEVARPKAVRAAEAAAANEGDPISYDDCPGGVKSAIGSEARNQKVIRVTKYAHRGDTIYRAVVGDGDRERIIRVTGAGKVYHEEDVTPAGGKVVEWDRLPAPSKTASGREAGAAKPVKVYQFTRGDVTHYRVVLDTGRNFDVTDDGKIVAVDDNGNAASATPAARKRR